MMPETIPEDLALEDVACLRVAADIFLAQGRVTTDPEEREILIGYARLYREMAAWCELSETEDDEP